MIIIGIDPAIRTSGYSVIEYKNMSQVSIIDCGVIKNTAAMPHSECLRRLSCGIDELVKTFQPAEAAIEDAFYGRNVKTSMVLSMARGAIIAQLAVSKVAVTAYSPKSAKKAVTGRGTGSKEQIAGLLAMLYNIDVSSIPLDATDAVALALCHGLAGEAHSSIKGIRV